jgi:16S rRNA (guanine966-N2)-methyltransferase
VVSFNLVFLDPPFRKQLLQPACEELQNNGWLAPNALIYVEAEKELNPLPR